MSAFTAHRTPNGLRIESHGVALDVLSVRGQPVATLLPVHDPEATDAVLAEHGFTRTGPWDRDGRCTLDA